MLGQAKEKPDLTNVRSGKQKSPRDAGLGVRGKGLVHAGLNQKAQATNYDAQRTDNKCRLFGHHEHGDQGQHTPTICDND
jgi:hypothetical protein